ncbi:MAG TPA: DUF2298 domain-containing protein [Nevskiaceae bacterium]|nr:DUF2298 domain-containing protein [Nevskiaceae bacterium]
MTNYFFHIYWWLLLFGIGIAFWPLTYLLFPKFFDKGYTFSKILGALVVSYIVWFLGSLKILPFLTSAVWLVAIFLVIGNFLLFKKDSRKLKKEIKKNWKIFAFEEALFFTALAFWAYVRGCQPNIQGLEKFMDYGFVNSILRARFFPPADMWLAGKTVNYYYFGHLVTAVLTKLSGFGSAITYNLMIATLFAFCLTATFCLAGNFIWLLTQNKKYSTKKKIRLVILTGLISAFLLTLGGNLHPFYWWLKNQNFSGYWYPDATRFIVQKFGAADNTIHEFPIYSFVVADLHGHLLNLPFVLLFLAILLTIAFRKKISLYPYIMISFLLAVFYMTNAWDLPIYLLVFSLTFLVFKKSIKKTFLLTIGIFILAILFSLPYHFNFQNITQGIGLVEFHSPIFMPLVLWGWPVIITLSFLGFLLVEKKVLKKKLTTIDLFVLCLLAVSWLLIFIPEIIYVQDIYIHSYQRANTMFKLTYQSFVMFSLTSGYIIIRILTSWKQKFLKILYFFLIFPFLLFIFVYPYFAITSYYGLKNYRGLEGLNYLKKSYPDDYQAIVWLKQNVTGQPVITEAVGESYTDYARVSANTGLPTILGWRVHEWLWRGSFDEPAARTEVVREIYESSDLTKTKALLDKYQVVYIFVGTLEKEKYPQLQKEKFSQSGEIVFSSGDTKIYQVKH